MSRRAKDYFFLNSEVEFRGRYSKSSFEALYFAYRPYLWVILTAVVIGFLGRLLLLSTANFIGLWVDSFCLNSSHCRDLPSLVSDWQNEDYFFAIALVVFIGIILTLSFRIIFSRVSSRAVSRLYDEVTLRTSRFPMRFFDTHPVGRIVTRFSSDYGSIFRLFGGPLAEFLSLVFDLVAMLILVSISGLIYLPFFLFVAFCNFFIFRLNRERMRRERRSLSYKRGPSISHFSETLQGATSIRIFGREGSFTKRFLSLNMKFLNQKLKTIWAILIFSYQLSLFSLALIVCIGALGLWLVGGNLVSAGSVGVAFTFVVLSTNTLQMFFEWIAQFEEAMTGVERLDNYLRHPLELGQALPISRKFPTKHPVWTEREAMERSFRERERLVNASVSFNGVCFGYDPNYQNPEGWVLNNLNFTIEAGEKIGVIGETGSGKSSLVNCLFYLYPLAKGNVAVNNYVPDLLRSGKNGIDLFVYRQLLSLIPQETVLFQGSLRDNLDFSRILTDAEIEETLRLVGLRDWFTSLSNGLDFRVSERGGNLSSGQKQLVCLARCILKRAPVVVMDEATSQIDLEAEEVLIEKTKKFFNQNTLIVIAHRLSTIRSCDRILWLDKGLLRRFDSPEKVLDEFLSLQ